jgi:hypothetical protein
LRAKGREFRGAQRSAIRASAGRREARAAFFSIISAMFQHKIAAGGVEEIDRD